MAYKLISDEGLFFFYYDEFQAALIFKITETIFKSCHIYIRQLTYLYTQNIGVYLLTHIGYMLRKI